MEKEVSDLKSRVQRAVDVLKLPELKKQLADLDQKSAQPDFWSNNERAQSITKQQVKLRDITQPWDSLKKNVQELQELIKLADPEMKSELAKQLAELEKEYTRLEIFAKLSGKYDGHDAILAIHAGTGGVDAMDWAQILERMYLRFAEKAGFKAELIEEQAGEEAGLKHATVRIEGPYAYGKLKSEHGVHRLVRLSPFNADNLRQTSFALVEVLPEIIEPGIAELDEKDLKIDVFRAGGHGGQSVNTTDSAVRVTHIPTGVTVAIQNERSQLQNKETALKILKSKIVQLQLEQHKEHLSEIKGPDKQAAWGNQIRNYVLHPYTLVKDTRTGFETKNVNAVLDGELNDFIESYLEYNLSQNDELA